MMDSEEIHEIDLTKPKKQDSRKLTCGSYFLTCIPSTPCQFICTWILIPLIIITIPAMGAIYEKKWSFPTILQEKNWKNSTSTNFSESRCMNGVIPYLTMNIGARLVGTKENIESKKWLEKQLLAVIELHKKTGFRVEYEEQHFVIPGSFQPIQNLLVRVSDEKLNPTVEKSILLNAHYDSSFPSPGAGDNAIAVATCFEILRIFLNRPTPPKRPIVFLFNNAEEIGLWGAQFFAGNHSWAWNVERFINLDSMSPKGKVNFFRGSPSSIASVYSSVPHPHGTVIGEEIIQFIPSGTDFSVFINVTYNRSPRVKKKLQGLDLAYYTDGYEYHTDIDDITKITPGSIQLNGENVLALLKQFDDSDLEEPLPQHENYVYFDILGFYFIYLSEPLFLFINITLIISIMLLPPLVICLENLFKLCLKIKTTEIKEEDLYDREPRTCCVILCDFLMASLKDTALVVIFSIGYLISIAMAFSLTIVTAIILAKIKPHSWYAQPLLGVALFGTISYLGLVVGQWLINLLTLCFFYNKQKENINHKFQRERYMGLLLVLAILLTLTTFFRIRSSYFITLLTAVSYGSFLFVSIVQIPLALCVFKLKYNPDYEELKPGASSRHPQRVKALNEYDYDISEDDFDHGESERIRGKEKQPLKLILFGKNRRISLLDIIELINDNIWYIIPLATSIPGILIADTFTRLFWMLVPTSGRMFSGGGFVSTDLIIGCFVCFFICLLVLNFMPLSHKADNFGKVALALLLISGGIFLLALFYPQYSAACPKRIYAYHQWNMKYQGVVDNGNLIQMTNTNETSLLFRSADRVSMEEVIKTQYKSNTSSPVICSNPYTCLVEEPNVLVKQPTLLFQFVNSTFYQLDFTQDEDSYFSIVTVSGNYESIVVSENSLREERQDNTIKKIKLKRDGVSTPNWKIGISLLDNQTRKVNVTLKNYYYDMGKTPYLTDFVERTEYVTLGFARIVLEFEWELMWRF